MSTPVASNLILLADLGGIAPGTKVRFLGCVDEYVVKTATLILKHHYPATDTSKTANVNIDHVLESVKSTAVDVGSWINVLGYVEWRKETGVFVQAVAVWGAGNLDLDAYEKAVERRKEAG